MFYKFLLESFRNKRNRPLSFFINWIGLTLGFAAVMVIYIFIMQQIRHDKDAFSDFPTQVYRVNMGETDMGNITPSGLKTFAASMPEVEAATRMLTYPQVIATQGLTTEKRMRFNVIFGDTTMLELFPFKFIAGDAATALNAHANAIVSVSTADKLFGTTDVVGKTILLNNSLPATITGVIEDVPVNSSFTPDVIGSLGMTAKMWGSTLDGRFESWGHWSFETYIKLKPSVNIAAFEPKFGADVVARISEQWGSKYENKVTLLPFGDCYFAYGSGYSHAKSIDPNSLYIMGVIALLVLVIAIINYVNIYTARSTEVIRAMGVKTIMGARRSSLILYIIGDSILMTLLAALSAYILATPLEALYPNLFGESLRFDIGLDVMAGLFVGLPIICGVLSGIFPAISLTRLAPLDAIANRNSGGKQMGAVRNALIVFQFAITIALISSTIFINKQMAFMAEADLGYNRENIVNLNGENFLGPKFDALRTKLLTNPSISKVAYLKSNPVSVGEFMTISWGETSENSTSPNIMLADENFLDIIGLKTVEGKAFDVASIKPVEGERRFMINESLAKIIRAQIPDVQFPFTYNNITYLGVFSDYQNQSLAQAPQPMVYGSIWNNGSEPYGNAYIKIAGGNIESTIKFIENAFRDLYPDQLCEWSFLDAQFDDMYRESRMLSTRLFTFSMLAIFIGCLGLFALVSYSVERRRKEIAIRKVYGSTVGQILTMLSISFLRWLAISLVIAIPIVIWAMNDWVEQYTIRTHISWWIFGIAAVATLIVALGTVISQSYHAATQNPSKYLY